MISPGPGLGSPASPSSPIYLVDDPGDVPGVWYIDHLDHTLAPFQTFRPENLHFIWRESDVSDIDYEISRSAVDTFGFRIWSPDFIAPWRTGWRLRIGNRILLEGVHYEPGIQLTLGGESMAVSGKDYTVYYNHRHFPFDGRDGHRNDFVIGTPAGGLAYEVADTDIADIIEAINDKIQSRDYSLPISFTPSGPVGIAIDYTLALGDTSMFLSLLQGWAGIYPGFEFEVTKDRELKLYSPKIYGDPDALIADPDSFVVYTFSDDIAGSLDPIDSLTFGNNGPKYTHVLGQGAGLVNQVAYALDYVAGMEQFWRIDGVEDYGNVTSQGEVNKRTISDLSFGLNPVHEISLVIRPDAIPNFWRDWKPGKAIYLKIDLDAHQLDSPHEIVEMDVTPSNEGNTLVTLGLNQIYSVPDGFVGNPEG